MQVNIQTMKTVSAEKKQLTNQLKNVLSFRNEIKLAKITLAKNENQYKCSSCMLNILLMVVVFTICARIGTYIVYYNWSLVKNASRIKFNTRTQTTIQ